MVVFICGTALCFWALKCSRYGVYMEHKKTLVIHIPVYTIIAVSVFWSSACKCVLISHHLSQHETVQKPGVSVRLPLYPGFYLSTPGRFPKAGITSYPGLWNCMQLLTCTQHNQDTPKPLFLTRTPTFILLFCIIRPLVSLSPFSALVFYFVCYPLILCPSWYLAVALISVILSASAAAQKLKIPMSSSLKCVCRNHIEMTE